MVFQAGKGFQSLDVKFKEFVLPDFKSEVKLKDQLLPDPLKNYFKISTTIVKFESEIVASDYIKTT